jgi:hypothetical protein
MFPWSQSKNPRPSKTPPRLNKRVRTNNSPARGSFFATSLQSVPLPAFLSQTFSSLTAQPLPCASFQPPPTLSPHVPQQPPAAAAHELGAEDVEPQTVLHEQPAERQSVSLEGRTVRSPQKIIEERNKKCRDWDFGKIPMQCFPTEKALVDAIVKNAENYNTDGGAHGIPPKANTLKTELKTTGPRRLLQCDRYREHRGKPNTNERQTTTKRCDCKWGFWIEQSTHGWMFAQPSNQQYLEEVNTNANLRGLTEEQLALAEILSRAGETPSQIYHKLQQNAT